MPLGIFRPAGKAHGKGAKLQTHHRRCTNRSAWRLPPGKTPERLSPYYQLDCDFGTALVLIWKTDGTEPLYLCEEHAKELRATTDRSAGAGPAHNREKKEQSAPEAHGKPARPAQSAAERSLAIDRQISELNAQLESILAQSQATISVASAIDAPLEQSALGIIGDAGMTDMQKDTAIEQLGALQESIKQGAGQEIAPLKAHEIRQALGNHLQGDAGNANPAHRAVCASLENAIHAAAPRSKGLEERIANLRNMKASLEDDPAAKELAPVVA
jgi:hypothetical protein